MDEKVISLALILIPKLRLPLARNRGFERDVLMLKAQSYDRFAEVHVAADSHAADKVPYSGLVKCFNDIGKLVF
jgi:hypothetical protein